MKIQIQSLFRNSETHLTRVLPQFESLLDVADCNFKFYQNDSTDNTLDILQDWGKAEVFSETLGAPSFGSVADTQRTALLSYYRNKLKCLSGPVEEDYVLLVDSDLFWEAGDLEKLIKSITEYGAAMITPNTQQNLPDYMHRSSETSYYDVYCLRDRFGSEGAYFSSCPFYNEDDFDIWNNGWPVQTLSSFAGFALIKSEIFNKVKWSSDFHSEHVNFCAEVNRLGDIYADPNVKPRTEVDLDKLNMDGIRHIALQQKKKFEVANGLRKNSINSDFSFDFG